MVMRVGGIASGMDIEAMVNKLMEAERMPLVRLQQKHTTLEWKRDAFREINSALLELDNIVRDMKYSTYYRAKSATSSNEGVLTASANSNASNGSYEIKVDKLATNEMQIANVQNPESFVGVEGEHKFYTYNNEGQPQEHVLKIEDGDTLEKVLSKIATASGNAVRGFYDKESNQVVLETTRTGVYNTGNKEITFESNSFFTDVLQFDESKYQAASNAKFTYNNGLELTSKDNSYTLNGMTFNFHSTGTSRVSVDTDIDHAFNNIKKFVDKYNEVIEKMNKSQTEEKFRDFLPLTEEQKKEMSEDQIKKWEEKAKSAILRGESSIRDGMFTLRQSMQSKVETGGEYTLLSQIGIKTTMNYMDGGKLEIDEEKLREALRDNPDDVYKLFTVNQGDNKGLIHRFDDALDRTRGRIEEQAGKSTHTLDNYAIGKQIKQLNERISDFEKRMIRVEQRYWNQFTAMEKAISNLNQQSSYLFSQFGGM